MTAIDFSSFVDRLASAAGKTILPFFRTALAIENKQTGASTPSPRPTARRKTRCAP